MKQILRRVALTLATIVSLSSAQSFAAETVLADVDFSTLTAGSENEPDVYKYMSSFSGFSGWSIQANKAGQAGGSLWIADGGTLKSPYFSGVSTTGGAIKVSAEVKLRNADAGIVQLLWGYSTTLQEVVEGSDWQVVDFYITPTSASSYSNYATFSPQWLADGMLIKNIKIAQSPEFLAPPVVSQPTNADGTSFTASWKAVSGATKYFIDVYSYASDGSKTYFIQNQEVTGTSYKVEGLTAGTVYYFVVRAANDQGVSGNSTEIEVVKYLTSLAAPEVKLASCDEDGNFTATWDKIEDADSYTVTVFKTVTLAEAGEASVFSENFDVFTSGSFTSLEYIYSRHLEALNEPGWDGYNMATINGAIGLTPYGSDAYIITPAIDLSADNGKFTVKVNMCANNVGQFKTGDIVVFTPVDADGNAGQAVEVTIDKLGFADYTVTLTGGAKNTKLKISSATNNKIFFDELEIIQTVPAGYATTSTYTSETVEATQYKGSVEFAEGTSYELVAVANGRTVSGGQISSIVSALSNRVAITTSTVGVEDIATETAAVTIAATGRGTIAVSTPEAIGVEVYDMTGCLIAQTIARAGTSTIALPATGLVIVKAGSTIAKIAL